jgi:hypothetical protein
LTCCWLTRRGRYIPLLDVFKNTFVNKNIKLIFFLSFILFYFDVFVVTHFGAHKKKKNKNKNNLKLNLSVCKPQLFAECLN